MFLFTLLLRAAIEQFERFGMHHLSRSHSQSNTSFLFVQLFCDWVVHDSFKPSWLCMPIHWIHSIQMMQMSTSYHSCFLPCDVEVLQYILKFLLCKLSDRKLNSDIHWTVIFVVFTKNKLSNIEMSEGKWQILKQTWFARRIKTYCQQIWNS